MNINRPLVPRFLKKAEQKLLLNKPGIWSTRTHLVLYYGILFILFLAALCFIEPNDVRDYTTTPYWIGFVSIVSVIALVVWLIYLLRFNVFKKYGNIHPLHLLVSFILYFISTGIIVSFVYVHPVVESVRANMAYGDEEIVQDINAMNIKICQLEYGFLQAPWSYDTVALSKDIEPSAISNAYTEAEVDRPAATVQSTTEVAYVKLDSAAFNDRITNADSTVKLNDTVCLVYATPTLSFVSFYNADEYTRGQILNSFELFNKVYRHQPTPAGRERISKELDILLEKYHYPADGSYSGGIEPDKDDTPFELVRKKYWLGKIENNIGHIIEKKYRWSNRHFSDFIRLFYYFTLGISLLILVFRHSTVRTFFLTLLTGVLLTIFTALLLSFSRIEEITFFIWLIAYTILFFAGSLITWRNKKRKAVSGILINLFVLIVTALPVLFVGCYYNWKREQYRNSVVSEDLSYIQAYFFYAEIGGALLLLVLLATYIGKVYRRWYSLPED
jgi:hypothetical protein